MKAGKFQICLWAMCISFEEDNVNIFIHFGICVEYKYRSEGRNTDRSCCCSLSYTISEYVGLTVPFPPRNVTIDVTPHHVLVTWDPPVEADDEITMYVVSYSILPDTNTTRNDVGKGSLFSKIPVEGHEGRLFKIQVQAQNHDGLGNPSAARYARIGCGRTIWLDPSASTSLIFPETAGTYRNGVLCQWTLSTRDTCFLTFTFVTLQLAVPSNKHCIDAYVNIGKDHYCHAHEDEKVIVSRDSKVIVIFNSGTWTSGKGFHLKIRSIKVPGPPTSITTQSNDNDIILTWTPPTGLSLPITSYVITYSVLPDGLTYSKVIEPNAFQFRIVKKYFDGKHLWISITARIEDVEGTTSDPLYVRVLKPPGPPTSFNSKFSGNAIILSWASPTGITLPLTSYVIRYTVQPFGPTYSVVLEPNILHFSIDTAQFDGKYLLINITSRIEDVEGVTSNPLYVRAVKPPGPPTSFTMRNSGNSVILTWAPPTGLTLPITSYVIRYSVKADGHTYSTVLEPNTFDFIIDTTLFEGKDLLINITAKIDDVEGAASVPLNVKPPEPRPTEVDIHVQEKPGLFEVVVKAFPVVAFVWEVFWAIAGLFW